MAGNAVFTMVESSVCMKKPSATSHNNGECLIDATGEIEFIIDRESETFV